MSEDVLLKLRCRHTNLPVPNMGAGMFLAMFSPLVNARLLYSKRSFIKVVAREGNNYGENELGFSSRFVLL